MKGSAVIKPHFWIVLQLLLQSAGSEIGDVLWALVGRLRK